MPEVIDGLGLLVVGDTGRGPDRPGLGAVTDAREVTCATLVVLVEFQGARDAHANHIGGHVLPGRLVIFCTSASWLDQVGQFRAQIGAVVVLGHIGQRIAAAASDIALLHGIARQLGAGLVAGGQAAPHHSVGRQRTAIAGQGHTGGFRGAVALCR